MFSHIHLGTSDFASAVDFYTPLMAELGLVLKFCDPAREWAGWQRPDAARPLFLIGRPYDRGAARPGNGPMTAFLAEDRATVDRVHALALSLGGQDDGPPGLRPHYHPDYYGAYFRDPDGNKICVCCHQDLRLLPSGGLRRRRLILHLTLPCGVTRRATSPPAPRQP